MQPSFANFTAVACTYCGCPDHYRIMSGLDQCTALCSPSIYQIIRYTKPYTRPNGTVDQTVPQTKWYSRPYGPRPNGTVDQKVQQTKQYSRPTGPRPDGTRPNGTRPNGTRPNGSAPTIVFSVKNYYTGPIQPTLSIWDHQNVFQSVLSSHPLLIIFVSHGRFTVTLEK